MRWMVALALMTLVCQSDAAEKRSNTPVDPETGREVMTDLPPELHLRNIRGKNGQGCCVYASSEMMGRYFSYSPLDGVLKQGRGGASKSDVDAMYKRQDPGFVQYVQAEGKWSIPHLEWAMRTRRLACVTIDGNHMVCLLYMDTRETQNPRVCILDNNAPGVWIWMPRAEFERRHAINGAWSHSLLLSPPPPIPVVSKGGAR